MKIRNYLESSNNFEKSIRAEQEKRLTFFKTVAYLTTAASLAMAIALAALLPLKTAVPYVIQVDKATGNQAVITSLTEKAYTPAEVEDRANIAGYVKAREGYVYDTIQRDYDKINLMSSAPVFKEYKNLFEGPNSLQKLKDSIILEPRIISICLQNSNGKKTALVRLEVIKKQVAGPDQSETSKTRLVTLSYDYYPDRELSEEERLVDPLGFRVDYYHAEDESLPGTIERTKDEGKESEDE